MKTRWIYPITAVIFAISITALAITPRPDPVEPTPSPTVIANGKYVITNRFSNKAMEVNQASSADGANVVQRSYSGGQHQQWNVTNLGNGYYSIRAAHSNKSLDVYEWNANDGADARQWTYLGGDNQQWRISAEGNGWYNVISRFSGKALEVYNFSSADGGNIALWSYWGGDPQLWRFQVVEGTNPSEPPTGKGSNCRSTGSVTVNETIRVTSGVYDGGCRTFNPTSALGDGGQSEGQKPVFRVENGATLKNVIIGNNGADGIHVYNGGTVENVRWTNVGEDALTVKSQGNVTVRNVEGYNGSDKFIQVNAETNLTISNCIVDDMGKFLRQNGGTTFPINVQVTNCDISNMNEGIFRTDSPNSTARITNSRLRNAGNICIGPWRSCTSSGIGSF